MSEILDQAIAGIQHWNEVRNDHTVTVPLFNQGSYFKITANAYTVWKGILDNSGYQEKDQSIHAYFSVDIPAAGGQLSLYGVDNYTDSLVVSGHESNYDYSLQSIPYEPATLYNVYFNQEVFPISGIDPLTALEQSTQWSLHKDSWLENQTNMAQVLVIPFSDIKLLFEQANVDFLVAQPAFSLKDEGGIYQLEIDLIIWGYSNLNGIIGKYPQDLIHPVPPYSLYPASDFQLLQAAL